jgi:branched-chain amino acid aminotransferase
LHIGATALHYGQACFEGLKAFCHSDGQVYCFRPEENAARMQSSCRRIVMPELPTDLFIEAVRKVVNDNIEYVPPYGSNGALYIRPILFGSGPRIGLQPADEYVFLIMVIPVGDYYQGGLSTPVDALIISDYDRAAPQGVGAVKVAGNYAADLYPNLQSKKKGFPISLYLDAKTQSMVEEFSTSNFVGINHAKKLYVTPQSSSVLPSITNKSLMQIAHDEGYTVEARDIPVTELADFDEVLAVGTAVVVTPVGSVTRMVDGHEQVYEFGNHELGETTKTLYQRVRAIQNGEADDTHGWNVLMTNE